MDLGLIGKFGVVYFIVAVSGFSRRIFYLGFFLSNSFFLEGM